MTLIELLVYAWLLLNLGGLIVAIPLLRRRINYRARVRRAHINGLIRLQARTNVRVEAARTSVFVTALAVGLNAIANGPRWVTILGLMYIVSAATVNAIQDWWLDERIEKELKKLGLLSKMGEEVSPPGPAPLPGEESK